MKKIITILLLVCLFALASCSVSVSEHTFSDEWSVNEYYHYRQATCVHKEFTKDFGEHTFDDDGKCIVCGYSRTVEPTPYVDKYYLPLDSLEYVDETLTSKTTYTYTDDLHGYTETFYNYIDGNVNYGKDVNTFAFNDDYTKLTLISSEYDVTPQSERLTRQRKYEYEFFDNSSYVVRCDEYDIDGQAYVFDSITAKFYNERKQRIYDYRIYSGEGENTFYYSDINKYEYDEDGFITKSVNYDGRYDGDYITYLQSFDIYNYDAENHMHAIVEEYYYSEDGYYKYGYTEITTQIKNGIRYDTEVIHNFDGSVGNTNKFGYDANFERVYESYGGMNSVEKIVKNTYNQIEKYDYFDDDRSVTMTVTYAENGGGILSSVKDTDYGVEQVRASSVYTYNEFNQITKVEKTATGSYPYEARTVVRYTDLQNDVLLKYFELFDKIIRYYSDNVLVEGL